MCSFEPGGCRISEPGAPAPPSAVALGRSMGTPKPRILPWLKSALDEGTFEGVAWLDESHTRFRVPWKHGLRQDAQPGDFRIFLAWAEASGAYVPGRDPPDLPTCKRNFRAALNRKEGLRVVDDRSRDPQDPHKIYEFVTPGAGDSSEMDNSPDSQEVLVLLNGLGLAPEYRVPSAQNTALEPTFPPLDNTAFEPSDNAAMPELVPRDAWDFEVTAFYRGRQVFQHTFSCPSGLRLVGPDAGDDGTLQGLPVALPDPGNFLTDQVVKDYVTRVLGSLGRGLWLWREGQWLCVKRLGHCHTFWALGDELLPPDSCGPDGEVPKEPGKYVFNLRPFVEGLIDFINGKPSSPHFTLWFCMGELWRQEQPWTKRLVMVKVVPTCLKSLLEMAREGGASSLNAVELHISDQPQPLALSSDQYRAYLEDMLEDMEQ
ncbi:interferon regulatory factor 3 isoform X1 [Sorex fumeus]|uniref:interferon regulatory factor 3 isoform X1 n=1 Tax=Sorex fumeus TaxID=62283 RepID=UPI0024ACC760|nr:interferon regulatory factor 3 isoform X1 [Sorex fumeus]